MVEKEKLMILKVSESKKPKQLRVTIPLNEGVEGGDYVQIIKVKNQNG